MKTQLSLSLALVLAVLALCPFSAFSEPADQQPVICSVDDFTYMYNFYDALLDLGHPTDMKQAEVVRFSDSIMVKFIFNNCEILSLFITPDAKDVKSVHISFSALSPGSSAYREDYAHLVMEALMACNLSIDSISQLFLDVGSATDLEKDTELEYALDGLTISYQVLSYSGPSFKVFRK